MPKDIEKIRDPKIKEQIEKMFLHYDVAEMTDERKRWVMEKFQTPKDFENLRIILGIIADEEAGLFIQRDDDAIPDTDRYEFEDRLRKGVKNTLKQVVLHLYQLTRRDIQEEKIKEVLSEQENEDRLQELIEQEKERQELEKKGSGKYT